MSYQSPRNVRRDSRTLVGRFRGGVLAPVAMVPVKGNEGGLLSQQITYELDPIAGRMITPITAELTAVFVPVQAMYALLKRTDKFAGLTDVVREVLLSGEPLFSLSDTEHEISKRCGINPRSIDGQKRVLSAVKGAHNAAVNHLRLRKYDKATQLLWQNTDITPALISQTVLERMNGVLDPDDRINGAVQLDIPKMQLPVTGIGIPASVSNAESSPDVLEATGDVASYSESLKFHTTSEKFLKVSGTSGSFQPDVFAHLDGAEAGGVSLTDFYNAETMDRLTRRMRQIVDDNPEYGEEMVLRWAHGLQVDAGKTPFVIYEGRQTFGRSISPATDKAGIEEDVMRSDMMQALSFTVPIPRTELGGIIVTFASIKPDETISSQPDPFLSDVWGAENFVADELALDPMPVTIRELDSDCDQADENTVVFYTGLNQLKATYVHYGLNRHLDPETIANKTAVWQLEVPLSVTPDTILYPENLEHYPFADQTAEVCTYVISSNAVIQTPMIIGPTPVEELAIIGDADLFEQDEE